MKNPLIRRLMLAVAIAGSGLLVGTATSSPLFAGDPQHCEEDECEGGNFCADNEGFTTGCGVEGSECYTYGCSDN